MKKFTLEIIEIIDETPDVKTFRLKRPEDLEFTAGQYCLVEMPQRPEFTEHRPFTYSSSPTQRDYVDLTIKRMKNFTQALFTHRPGDNLVVKGPLGEALNFDDKVTQDVVFMAGGSGITPFIPAIRYRIARGLKNRILLLYANRTAEDIIYRRELDEIADPDIEIVHILEDPPQDWPGRQGRINQEVVEHYAATHRQDLWYVCGPPPMVNAMKGLLDKTEIPQPNRRLEAWELPGKHDDDAKNP